MTTNKKECLMIGCTRIPYVRTEGGSYLCEHHYDILVEMGVKTMKNARVLEDWEITLIKAAA